MTYKTICDTLKNAGIESFALEASLLLCRFCGVTREQLFADREREFDSRELTDALALRVSRYPIQYILGEWQFCNETYKIGEGCLIPRPETEELVELAASLLSKDACFLDLCTGSGCIAISTLARRNDCRALGVDISDAALSYARENAVLNSVNSQVDFVKCDILTQDAAKNLLGGKKVNAVISNPPYIPSRTVETLEKELFAEPKGALDGGENGLVFYDHIVPAFKDSLENDGFFLFEIGYDQGDSLRRIANENGLNCEIIKDISGNDRIAHLTQKNGCA